MKTLDQIAIANGTDKATYHPIVGNGKGHGYTPVYEKFFEPFRDRPLKFLEIGVGGGESIRTWLGYFPKALIFGVDIVQNTNSWDDPAQSPDGRYKFTQGDQSDVSFWEKFITNHGTNWDVVMDDGAHVSQHIITTFNHLWPTVKPGGLYCIEDLHCSYYPEFQRPDFQTHMDFVKDMLDAINRSEREMESLHFSRQLAIVRKRALKRAPSITGCVVAGLSGRQ
jgi:hypothetical protein